jgi:fumarate hydratase class II
MRYFLGQVSVAAETLAGRLRGCHKNQDRHLEDWELVPVYVTTSKNGESHDRQATCRRLEQVQDVLTPALRALRDTLDARSRAFALIVMIGRTHLQDATPLTLGQVISGWVAQLDQALVELGRALPGLYELATGGTAVGTGLNADPRFGETATRKIAEETGKPSR